MKSELKNYYHYMDNILLYLVEKPDEPALAPDFIAERSGLKIEKNIAYLMCAKLAEDEFLKRHEQVRYTIKSTGLFFIKNGGYKQKLKLDRSRARLQSWQTWAIVLGTLAAGLYGIFEICKEIFNK